MTTDREVPRGPRYSTTPRANGTVILTIDGKRFALGTIEACNLAECLLIDARRARAMTNDAEKRAEADALRLAIDASGRKR